MAMSSCMMSEPKMQPPTVVKEGWIKRRDEYTRIWKNRYLVLENNGSLLEFRNKDIAVEPSEQFNLEKCEICLLEDFDCNGIVISWPKSAEKITLSTESEDERNEWLGALDSVTEDSLFAENKPSSSQTHRISLKDFELLKTLGRGAFGKVLLCKETRTNQLQAIKILKKQLIVQQNEVDHILTENQVLRCTDHPFLTALKYSFQTDHFICFVMEYVNGGDLFFHLNKEGSFTEDRTKFYAAETLLALCYLHSNGIIYRDLKTENMVLDKDGHIKLVDFGLCKQDVHYGERTHTFCGTPEYMAPEVIADIEYGQAVDWWGLGVVMYEMICAQLPFYNQNYDILITLITMKPVEFPGFISPTAQDLIKELLIKNPAKRLGSGPTDAEEIKNHAFFKNVDWNAIIHKRITTPFKPQLRSSTDTQYFDPEFTSEPVTLSESNLINEIAPIDDYFQDFSFQDTPDAFDNIK